MLKTRLSVMMFLQYGIWGAWLPLLYPFLLGYRHFSLDQVGMVMAAGAAGAICGPFLAGQIADRWFATERFLGLCHLIGAVLVWRLADTADYSSFLILSLVYGLVYAPTLALTNSLAFTHLEDRDRDFGPVRLWGTIGWIAVGIGVGQWLLHQHTPVGVSAELIAAAQDAGRADAFRLSAILGGLMGLYCFTLPHTPPAKGQGERNATLEAAKEIRLQPLLTLFLLAVPVSIIHQFYFVHTSSFLSELQRSSTSAQGFAESINGILGVGGGGLMTIGQMTEIVVLGLIPVLAKRLSRKTLLGIGLCAYAGRMAIFAYLGDNYAAVLGGLALHGLCFGCFIFVAFMIVDEHTSTDVRASAQNLFNLVIIGIGIIVGSWFATSVVGNWATANGVTDYTKLFSIPMYMALASLLLLLLFYPSRERLHALGRDPQQS